MNKKMWGVEWEHVCCYYEPRVARFTLFDKEQNIYADVFLNENFAVVEPWHGRDENRIDERRQRALLNAIWELKIVAVQHPEVAGNVDDILGTLQNLLQA